MLAVIYGSIKKTVKVVSVADGVRGIVGSSASRIDQVLSEIKWCCKRNLTKFSEIVDLIVRFVLCY